MLNIQTILIGIIMGQTARIGKFLECSAGTGLTILIAVIVIYASLNTITLSIWGDPSAFGRPRLFHPPQIMVLHYTGMISPGLARIVMAVLFWGAGFFILSRYREATRKTSLYHPARDRIASFVRSHPGCHFGSILRQLEVNRGTLAYHLDQLIRLRIVSRTGDGKFSRYFSKVQELPGPYLSFRKHYDSHVRSRILQVLDSAASGSVSAIELKKELAITSPALIYHIRLLLKDNLISETRDKHLAGRPVTYVLTEPAKEMMQRIAGTSCTGFPVPGYDPAALPIRE